MPRPAQFFDWHTIVDGRGDDGSVENTAGRLRWLLGLFVLAAILIFARAVQLEVSDGAEFRRLAAEPIVRKTLLAAQRGMIVDRNGMVLAADRMTSAVAIEYRYLEQPSDPVWLRRLARNRLPKSQRRDRQRLTESESQLRRELVDLHARLAKLCGLDQRQWLRRVARVDRQVKQITAVVNARRFDDYEQELLAEDPSSDISLATLLTGLFAPPERLPPTPIVVAEQRTFHTIVEDVPDDVAREIRDHPERWPGVKIVEHLTRDYPHASLAANLLGHVKTTRDGIGDAAGQMGLEHRFDSVLAGRVGIETRQVDRRGNLLTSRRTREPLDGQQLTLSIDARLQQAAETWLDRRAASSSAQQSAGQVRAGGGAIVVLDVQSGEVLTAASGPRFDPNWFVGGDARVESVLADARQPLFDRATKMAIAPGSVFKPLTAIALVESHALDPAEVFRCQGYFDDPDRLRCQIYRQHGVGHGDITLADALAQSCNVYFFHHAPSLGGAALADWASRFGFGVPTAADVDDEASGTLPSAGSLRTTGAVQQLAIGQGTLTATPLQIARLYTAIANDGRLVTPRFLKEAGGRNERAATDTSGYSSLQSPVSGLSASTLETVREGLRRVVDEPHGTAHQTVRLTWPAIAGKTGTAETGGGLADHAWFAGYVPADAPRYAFVVVLEHGGSGATAAGTIARQLVLQMRALGYFGEQPVARRSDEN